jgi:hypothetical protein
MVWLPPRELTVEGILPPEYPTVQPADGTQPASIVDSMPDPTTIEVKAQNVMLLELNMPAYLENRGLSKIQVAAYISDVSIGARQFKVHLDVQPPFFLTLHLPKQWKVKGATVDGKTPEIYAYDPDANTVFMGITEASSPVDVVLQLEPTMESITNAVVGVFAIIIIIPFIKAVIKEAIEAFRKR